MGAATQGAQIVVDIVRLATYYYYIDLNQTKPKEMIELPETTEKELLRLKEYFPFRIVWCAHRNGEWVTGATLDKREPNKHSRNGWAVFIVSGNKK